MQFVCCCLAGTGGGGTVRRNNASDFGLICQIVLTDKGCDSYDYVATADEVSTPEEDPGKGG